MEKQVPLILKIITIVCRLQFFYFNFYMLCLGDIQLWNTKLIM